MNEIKLSYPVERYPLEVVRYVFYTFTPDFWIFIEKNKKEISVTLKPKNMQTKIDKKKLLKKVEEEFQNELLREKIMNDNLLFREKIIKKAITYTPPPQEPQDYVLTPEEQEELERLIKEAEEEIRKELKKERKNDIYKTWEEKHNKKNR